MPSSSSDFCSGGKKNRNIKWVFCVACRFEIFSNFLNLKREVVNCTELSWSSNFWILIVFKFSKIIEISSSSHPMRFSCERRKFAYKTRIYGAVLLFYLNFCFILYWIQVFLNILITFRYCCCVFLKIHLFLLLFPFTDWHYFIHNPRYVI